MICFGLRRHSKDEEPSRTYSVESEGGVALSQSFVDDDLENEFGGEKKEEKEEFEYFWTASSRVGCGICILAYFVVETAFVLFETIVPPLTQDWYGWDDTNNSPFFSILAGCATLTIICVSMIPSKMAPAPKRIILLGLVCMSIGALLQIKQASSKNIPLYRFWIAFILLLGIGHPITEVNSVVLYSNVILPKSESIMMGWFTAVGSFARCIVPIAATAVYEKLGPRTLFASMGALLLLTLCCMLFGQRLLEPTYKTQLALKI